MNVLKKRFVPLVLACVLVMALAAPAFAASTSPYSTTLDGQYVQAEIDVTVPTTGRVFINPYALPVKLTALKEKTDATDSDTNPVVEATGGSILNQQIVTEPMFITNKSEVNLAVKVHVTATVHQQQDTSGNNIGKGIKFVATAPKADDTGKSIYAYLQMKVADELDATSTWQDKIDAFTGWKDDSYNKGKDLIFATDQVGSTLATNVTSSKGVTSAEPMVILDAGVEASGGSLDATSGSIAMFRIAGQVTTAPSDGWDPNNDSFQANIAFTFTPDPNKAKITGTGKTLENASSGDIALTVSLTGVKSNKITKVVWTNDAGNSEVSYVTSGTNGVTCTVSYGTAPAEDTEVTFTATVTASNGRTYTAEYIITVKAATP